MPAAFRALRSKQEASSLGGKRVPRLTLLQALLLISSFLVLAAILAQFTPQARNRPLEDLSP